jgi:hypothetical protein
MMGNCVSTAGLLFIMLPLMKITTLFPAIFSLLFALVISGCGKFPIEEEGEGPPAAVRLSSDEVAHRFFAAYKTGDRNAALAVAESKAIGKLVWDGGTGKNPNMKLVEESIVYEGGAINLEIQGDGHVGSRVADLKVIVD